jgi:hypothetical protein
MVTSWHAASPAVNDHASDDPPDRLVEHRQAIVTMLPRDKQSGGATVEDTPRGVPASELETWAVRRS